MTPEIQEELENATLAMESHIRSRNPKECGLKRRWSAGGSSPWETRYMAASHRLYKARMAAGWELTRRKPDGSYYIISRGN